MLVVLAVLFSLQAITGSASARTIYVEPGNSIQMAISNSHSGDTIIVKPGTYDGDIQISTGNLTLVSSSPYKAIINAKNNAFDIYESNVKIKDFDIRGQGKSSGICFSFTRSDYTNGAFFCTIENNKISNFSIGADVGYYLCSGSESILNNSISNCGTGINAFDLMFKALTINGNQITNCDNGLYLVDAPCTVTNNHFNNTVNLNTIDGITSTFNATKTTGENIVGGSYLGGNYWATPSGDGFSQTHSDNNGDGFADEPYKLDGYNCVDYLPLIPLKIKVVAYSTDDT
jgi:hypothetical protein